MRFKYTNIQGWMYNIGCDNLKEIVAYSVIYGFSQDNESAFNGSLSYIQKFLMCSKNTAIDTIRSLEDKGLIKKEQMIISGVKFNRYMAIEPVVQNLNNPCSEIEHNNINNNNTPISKDIIPTKEQSLFPEEMTKVISNRRFSKPTIEEIKAYCMERRNMVDAESFFYFYESKGWRVGNAPMKDWRAAIRTWEQKEKKRMSPSMPVSSGPVMTSY